MKTANQAQSRNVMMQGCKLRNFCLILLLGCLPILAQAQLQSYPLSRPATKQAGARLAFAAPDTLSLPFWEDFSSTPGPAPDSSRWLPQSPVFVNTALAVRPPSLGVATFDGLNAEGRPYSNDSNLSGPADSLVSQPIDLSGLSAAEQDSVFLSFFWQLEGRGDRPDAEDSLALYFLTADTSWVRVWQQGNDPVQDAQLFRQELLSLSELSENLQATFFHSGFQFKFQSRNRLSGQFDLWHLDYVYLDKGRYAGDLYYPDRTLSEPVGSLLQPYTALPMAQFRRAPESYLADSLPFVAFSLRAPGTIEATELNLIVRTSEGELVDTLASEQLLQDEENRLLEGQRYFFGQAPGLPAASLQPLLERDSLILESLFSLTTEDNSPLFNQNDTLRIRSYLTDYFAYDDGTAEIGVGLNGTGQRLAVAFSLEEADTLTHLRIAFPYYQRNPSGEIINLKIWHSLADTAGTTGDSLLYEQLGVPIPATTDTNGFVEIPLLTPQIIEAGTFYIGFEQRTDGRLAIGFDRNSDATEFIFSSADGLSWVQGFEEPGALQIRPRFQQGVDPGALGVEDDAFPETVLYPNPASGFVRLKTTARQLQLFDVHGRQLQSMLRDPYQGELLEINLQGLPNGLYFLRLSDGKRAATRKLIIKQ